jgi:hypothetical protein
MAHKELAQSAVYSGIIHWLFMYLYSPPIFLMISYGLGTAISILNHSYTSGYLVNLDRGWMFIGGIGDILTIWYRANIVLVLGVIVSAALYGLSRTSKHPKAGTHLMLHLASHIGITITHIALIVAIYNRRAN